MDIADPVCGVCGTPVHVAQVELHKKWHKDLDERFKSIFQGLSSMLDLNQSTNFLPDTTVPR